MGRELREHRVAFEFEQRFVLEFKLPVQVLERVSNRRAAIAAARQEPSRSAGRNSGNHHQRDASDVRTRSGADRRRVRAAGLRIMPPPSDGGSRVAGFPSRGPFPNEETPCAGFHVGPRDPAV